MLLPNRQEKREELTTWEAVVFQVLESGFTKTTTKNRDGDLQLSEKKVSLVNALPPPLDLLAPPPKEAPQLSPFID